jgi:DNA-binding IclR family transcriptional regulator
MAETKIVNSVIRSASILRILGEGVSRVEDIYPRVGLSRSTTHRLLKSLVAAGFTYQDPVNRNYHVGPLVLQLASHPSISHKILITCSEDELRNLRDLIGETVLLIIANGKERVVLEQIPSAQKLAYQWDVGATGPIHVGSSGKVLLSQLDSPYFERILHDFNLEGITSGTITDADILMREIKRIEEKGYATSIGEDAPGSIGISAPILGYTTPVALCLLAPEFRLKPTKKVLNELKASASRIEGRLKNIFPMK